MAELLVAPVESPVSSLASSAPGPAAFDGEQAIAFLELLFANTPGEIVISAPLPPDDWRNTRTFRTVRQAAAWAGEQHPVSTGVYVRMTTVAPGTRLRGRGTAEDSFALPALWCDLDYGVVGHSRNNGLPLPPDAETALKCIDDLPEPSLLVDSGHGWHGYWLLDEPVTITDADRADIAARSKGFQRAIKARAERLGYHYGAEVGDLARVLRLPGSLNRKTVG